MKPAFHEWHARSAFSFLEGASQPEEMVRVAARLGLDSITLADRGGFHGSVRAHQAAVACGIRAYVGTTLEMPDGTAFPVICATRDGYRAISRHLTGLHLAGHTASPCRGPADGLPDNHPNGSLIALTGDRDGPVCRPLLRGDRSAALEAAKRLVQCFGQGNVYVELTRHGLRDDGRLSRALVDLAANLRLPVLASNAPLFAWRGGRCLADAFTCLRKRVTLDQAGALLAANGERHLKPPRDMANLFADLPEALDNTARLAGQVGFTLENLGYRFPDFPDAQGKPLSAPEQATLLRRLTYQGAARRGNCLTPAFRRQLEHELALIQKLGFPGYFLIVHDLVEFAKGRGMLCQGRGSAANSAVCYALGITAVDPVACGLLFERFLSENRRSWPDIDIDFPSGERREEVIQYVFRKYGPRNAAMTANVITYQPRSAFREMSKVLGFPPSVADRFAENPAAFHRADDADDTPTGAGTTADDFEERVASILPPSHPRLAALARLYHSALGLPRHLGQHSGGMIICDHGLDAVVPLQPATMPGRTVVQWDKDDCEDMGIVKIDLLGLGMLAAMEDTLEILARRGRNLSLADLPKDDAAVFDLLCRADTVGTFQVESRAQMATLPIMRPQTFYDLAIQVAIIRPGPIVGDLVHPYLNRRNGREPVDFIHPACEEVLKRTLGVPLFQEQVLRMAMAVADFSGAEADELRRAMAFKRSDDRMRRVTDRLRKRMNERGVKPEAQRKIIDSIGSFALYGFPESHAISFALIAYASCWLKVHHPAAFFAGLLNHQPMGFYPVNTLLEDARRHRVRVRPVCCAKSGLRTDLEDEQTLRLGLNRLKGLSSGTALRIIAERETADFKSLEDFLGRVRPTTREKRLLARAGALNSLEKQLHRRQALWQVELPLHDDLLNACTAGHDRDATGMTVMSPAERLAADFATLSATTGAHPMKLWRLAHGRQDMQRAADLAKLPAGTPVCTAGMVICRQRPGTAKGHCFISLEDESGIANLFVHRETFHRLRLLIGTEDFLMAHGVVQRSEGDQPTVYVRDMEPLPHDSSGIF